MAWYDGAVGAVGDAVTAGFNYFSQKQNLDYQKSIQQQIFDREDTAMQRAMADAEKAGLNPQLAAGHGAGAGSIVSTEAPQLKTNPVGSWLDAQLAKESIKQAEQATEQAKLKTDADNLNNQYLKLFNDNEAINGALNRMLLNNKVMRDTALTSNLFGDKYNPFTRVENNGVNGKWSYIGWLDKLYDIDNGSFDFGERANSYYNSSYNQHQNQGEYLVKSLQAKDLYNAYMFMHGLTEEDKHKYKIYDEVFKGINSEANLIRAIGSLFPKGGY